MASNSSTPQDRSRRSPSSNSTADPPPEQTIQLLQGAPLVSASLVIVQPHERSLAPFLVLDRANGPRSGIYEDEPRVCLEVEPDTKVAYFEAEWSEGRWMFGHRVPDPDWAETSEAFPWLTPEPT